MTFTKRHRLAGVVAALLAFTLVAAGCGAGGSSTGQEAKSINIGYINWNEDVAVTHLLDHLLSEKGYDVELSLLEAGPLFTGLSKGDTDLFMDGWLPATHKKYMDKYGEDIEKMGAWYDNATLEVTVPKYMSDVNTIGDLKKKQKELDGAITGIGEGAGETGIVRDEAMPAYGLDKDFKLDTSSSAAMLTSLDKAVTSEQPIAVTLWHPHWAYGRYDLKDLKDPKGAMGSGEKIYSLGRTGFGEDFPQLSDSLKDFKMNDEQLSSLSNAVNKAEDDQKTEAAAKWAKEHPKVVEQFQAVT